METLHGLILINDTSVSVWTKMTKTEIGKIYGTLYVGISGVGVHKKGDK